MHRGARSWLGVTGLALGLALTATGCSRDDEEQAEPAAVQPPPPEPPDRKAAVDEDLRVMVAELAAAKACEMMRGQFRGLRGSDRPDVVTGIFWTRGCRIAQRGTELTFHLSGDGWQWVEGVKQPAGATFALHQYVRFRAQLEIHGALDLAYDPRTHVASFWFTPKRAPKVDFEPIGKVDVDARGAWSSVVGALGSIAGSSPDEKGEQESTKRGAHEFQKSFADGFAVTLDLCSGLSRFGLERPRRGEMIPPDLGETRQVPAEVHPGGMLIVGPNDVADRGLSIRIRAREGAVHAQLLCKDQAEALGRAFMTDPKRLPAVRPLASADVRATETLRTRGVSCPVMVVVRPLAGAKGPAVFDWQRPTREAARAAGGAIVQCDQSETRKPR
jgi:hypothetical protein